MDQYQYSCPNQCMEWSEQAPSAVSAPPPTIKNHSVTYFGNYLYCFGGYDGNRNHMTLLLYNIAQNQWIPTMQQPQQAGGGTRSKNNNGAASSNIRPANTNMTNTPFVVDGTPPQGRNGHTATLAVEDAHHARIIIIGGWLGQGPLAASDVNVLTISTGPDLHEEIISMEPNSDIGFGSSSSESSPPRPQLQWYQPTAQGPAPGPCNMHSADYVSSQNEVYVFRGGNGREYLNDLHALHVGDDGDDDYKWRLVETNGAVPQQRANHCSAVLDETNELIIFGGWNGSERLNDVHLLDIETSTWTCPRVGGVLPHPRAGMTLTALRGKLFLFGGSGTSSKCFSDLQILDRTELTWLDVSEDEGIANTSSSSALGSHHHSSHHHKPYYNHDDYESRMVASRRSNNNDNWHHQSTPNPNDEESVASVKIQGRGPGRRAGHTATAVMGRKLYIFGGSCGTDYLNDFFILDTDPPTKAYLTHPTSVQLVERDLRHFLNPHSDDNDENNDFSDVVFVVEGRKVHGHKLILSIVSDCFRAMFHHGFRESETNAEIEIPDCSYTAFTTMMEYIYTGHLPPGRGDDDEMSHYIEILELADQFFLEHLKQICEAQLESHVNGETVDWLHQVAQKTNAAQLLHICQHYQRNSLGEYPI